MQATWSAWISGRLFGGDEDQREVGRAQGFGEAQAFPDAHMVAVSGGEVDLAAARADAVFGDVLADRARRCRRPGARCGRAAPP